VEARGDGVAGVEERDAGVEVGGDGIALAGAGECPCPSASVSARRSSTHAGGASEDADKDSTLWGPGGADIAPWTATASGVLRRRERMRDSRRMQRPPTIRFLWNIRGVWLDVWPMDTTRQARSRLVAVQP
jgi:hypothetical protein